METTVTRRPFSLRYVCQKTVDASGNDRRATFRTAEANYAYITRTDCIDSIGATPNFAAKGEDLVATGRTGPIRSSKNDIAGSALWRQADQFANGRRPDEATAVHIVASLPGKDAQAHWQDLVRTFCEDQIASRGMIADWAIHALAGTDDRWRKRPHCHLLVTARTWDRDPGRRQKRWFANEAHKHSAAEAWYELTGIWPDQRYELGKVA